MCSHWGQPRWQYPRTTNILHFKPNASFVGFVLHSFLLSGDFLLKQEKGLKGAVYRLWAKHPWCYDMDSCPVDINEISSDWSNSCGGWGWGKNSIIKKRGSFQKGCQHRSSLCQTFLLLTRYLPLLSVTQPIAKLLLVKAQTDSTKTSLHIWESSLLLPCTLGRGGGQP